MIDLHCKLMEKICCIIDYVNNQYEMDYENSLHPFYRRYVRKTAQAIHFLLKRGFRPYNSTDENLKEMIAERTVVFCYLNPMSKSSEDIGHMKKLVEYCDFVCMVCNFENKKIFDIMKRAPYRTYTDYAEFLSIATRQGMSRLAGEDDKQELTKLII